MIEITEVGVRGAGLRGHGIAGRASPHPGV